jgi:DNA-directed RNA polymerase specialized sigma24 family protein
MITESNIRELLTPLERSVLICCLDGLSHKETSEKLGKSRKSVENAVFRVKKKLRSRYAKEQI